MNATSITAVQPLHVAAGIEMQQQECAASTDVISVVRMKPEDEAGRD